MEQITECCAQCGIKLFDQPYEGMSRKIFRSFYTKEKNGSKYYLCIKCAENKNLEEIKNEYIDSDC